MHITYAYNFYKIKKYNKEKTGYFDLKALSQLSHLYLNRIPCSPPVIKTVAVEFVQWGPGAS